MFKKLRNKFLMLNMIMISILLIGSFAVVFTITYNNVNREVDLRLDRGISSMRVKDFDDGFQRHSKNGEKNDFFKNQFSNPEDIPQAEIPDVPDENSNRDFTPMPNEPTTVKLDSEFNILETRSPYEFEQEFYDTFIENAAQKLNDETSATENILASSHIIKYENSYWKYKLFEVSKNEPNIDKASYYISISNIDMQIEMLKKLIITLILVLLFALGIVFLICLHFANKSIKPIEEAWNKQNQFIADASHELKTPLTTINTNIDVLLAHGSSTIDSEKKWLTYIKDESTRMAKLTNDLLYLARVDHRSDDNIIKTEFSLSSAVQSVLLTMEAVVFEKNLILTDDIEEDINTIGDPSQIKQLIMILLDNAIKYTAGGGTINVSLKSKDRHAILLVRNTGDGIAPEDAEKIFDRFYRSDKSRARNSGGYGLGLAIAKSIVISHGGTIKLNTKQGEYTEFVVKLMI